MICGFQSDWPLFIKMSFLLLFVRICEFCNSVGIFLVLFMGLKTHWWSDDVYYGTQLTGVGQYDPLEWFINH